MSEMSRLLEDADQDPVVHAMLRAAGEDRPAPGAILGVATALGVGASLARVTSGHSATQLLSEVANAAGQASVVAQAPTAAGAVSVASVPVGWMIVKHLGVGLAAGALTMGGVAHVLDQGPSEQQPKLSAQNSFSEAPKRKPQISSALAREVPVSEPAAAEPEPIPHSGKLPRILPVEPESAAPRSSPPAQVSRDTPTASGPAVAAAKSLPTAAFRLIASPGSASENAATPAPPEARARELQRKLAEEVVLLDRARRALHAGEPASALKVLGEYGSKPRSGTLEPETLVLKVRALHGIGDRNGSAGLARRFIQRYPESRHVEAMRQFADPNP